MKPASVINHGENFVTLRATTDRPAEIREALAARDVQHVYKGDQNQAWDAVLANHCLARALGDSDAEATFFVQDERLGTSDARLTRRFRQDRRRFVLTEDYYRGRAGAVWEHQDISFGLFFTEAVSPEQYAEAGVNLHRAATLWEKHSAVCLADSAWLGSLASLGVTLPGAPGRRGSDSATRLGPSVNPEALADLARQSPSAALYYAFTKTDGLYGVVPVENDNAVISSIPAADAELKSAWRFLLTQVAARGAMRMAGSAAARRGVKARARRVGEWADGFLAANPGASLADFQTAFGVWLTREVFPRDRIEIDRASQFTHISRHDAFRLKTPESTLHFFLDLALRHPREFAEAYNDALNRVGFGLQRLKHDPRTGRFTPPFFVEFAPGGAGTPVYRYGIELRGVEMSIVTLLHSTGDIVLESADPIRSAHDFVRVLFSGLELPDGVSIVGKAAAFAAELQRSPRGLGLPRQGSKYAPMVDHLVAGLRARGVLDQPTGLLIRIGLNTLDRLDAMGEVPLRLPRFLHGPLQPVTTCHAVAQGWRAAASAARAELALLGRCRVGQHVHLLRLLRLNAVGEPYPQDDPRLSRLLRRLCPDYSGPDGSADSLEALRALGSDLPPTVSACIQSLTDERERLLSERRELAAAAAQTHVGGRLRPDAARLQALDTERESVECRLLLLLAAYVRRLWQRAESLPYVNDRPYTLALYLLFGADVFPPICRQVEFDIEYVSPCPLARDLVGTRCTQAVPTAV